ncbi:hypothetical protein BU16DRAFT_199904 [Lophium mytilinum]|uniref:Uncharacterized protein n=1 Tax=Lophium mytilinum TaxID=390894 RepID=A0A6A6RCI5_9PEZI|nr:hypothetical protein BU16DRAFT_199904 [Lophium mytilinum]
MGSGGVVARYEEALRTGLFGRSLFYWRREHGKHPTASTFCAPCHDDLFPQPDAMGDGRLQSLLPLRRLCSANCSGEGLLPPTVGRCHASSHAAGCRRHDPHACRARKGLERAVRAAVGLSAVSEQPKPEARTACAAREVKQSLQRDGGSPLYSQLTACSSDCASRRAHPPSASLPFDPCWPLASCQSSQSAAPGHQSGLRRDG